MNKVENFWSKSILKIFFEKNRNFWKILKSRKIGKSKSWISIEIFVDFRDFSRFSTFSKIFKKYFQNQFSIKNFQLFSLNFFLKPFKISCTLRISQFPVAWRPGGHSFLGIGGRLLKWYFFAVSDNFQGLRSVNLHFNAIELRISFALHNANPFVRFRRGAPMPLRGWF